MHVAAAIEWFFVAQVAAVALLLVACVARAGRAVGESRSRSIAWACGTAVATAAFLGATAALAASGWLRDFDTVPPKLIWLLLPVGATTVTLVYSPLGTRLAHGLSLPWIVGYQAFRIPVEIFLFLMYRAGAAPIQMTFEGWNYDVLTGLLAVPVALLAARDRISRRALLAWNWLGLALLANIVTIALLSTPTPLRVFMNDPPNVFVADPPYVWLPVFLVQAALFGHLLVFRRLSASRSRGGQPSNRSSGDMPRAAL